MSRSWPDKGAGWGEETLEKSVRPEKNILSPKYERKTAKVKLLFDNIQVKQNTPMLLLRFSSHKACTVFKNCAGEDALTSGDFSST